MGKIKKEEARYIDLPKPYDFGTARNKEIILNKCFRAVSHDIDILINDLHGSGESTPEERGKPKLCPPLTIHLVFGGYY